MHNLRGLVITILQLLCAQDQSKRQDINMCSYIYRQFFYIIACTSSCIRVCREHEPSYPFQGVLRRFALQIYIDGFECLYTFQLDGGLWQLSVAVSLLLFLLWPISPTDQRTHIKAAWQCIYQCEPHHLNNVNRIEYNKSLAIHRVNTCILITINL